jgi:S1-C subfamily serine protease
VKALEASRKGQAEAMQHIAVLNEETKAIQEQIEKLKQETTIDSGSVEIEKLKKEIENLKNKSNTAQTPTKTVVKDNTGQVSQPALKTQPISSASSNIKEKINYVVQIVCPVKGGTSSGTGSMIYGNSNSDSKILTNKHVLTGATGPCGIYRTQSYENTPVLYFKSGTSFVFSKDYDLAIITPDVKTLISYPNTNFQFNQSVDVFDKNVLVLGYPSSAGNNITLTKGVISGSENINGIVMYKTDAKIDNGNSGGAVFDEDGKFMGVPTLASQGNFASYGYIIPAKIVKNFLDLVEQEGYGKQNWQHPQLSLYVVSPSNTVPDLAPRTPQNPAPQPQEDSSLKIARCQAKRDADYSAFVSKADQMLADAVQKIKDEAKTFIDKQLQSYDACLIERPEVLKQYDSTMSPYDLCSFYLRNAEAKKTYTDQLIAQTKAGTATFYSQGKSATDNEYYQCINK